MPSQCGFGCCSIPLLSLISVFCRLGVEVCCSYKCLAADERNNWPKGCAVGWHIWVAMVLDFSRSWTGAPGFLGGSPRDCLGSSGSHTAPGLQRRECAVCSSVWLDIPSWHCDSEFQGVNGVSRLQALGFA